MRDRVQRDPNPRRWPMQMPSRTQLALLTGAPVPPVYGLAALLVTSITVTRPAQSALLPSLARTSDELASANVA